MRLDASTDGDIVVLTLEGSFLGGSDTGSFAEKVHHYIQQGCRKMVVDMRELDYMNSVGLGSLFAGYTMLRKADGVFVLANVAVRVHELLHLTQADQIIPICATVEDAKKIFAS